MLLFLPMHFSVHQMLAHVGVHAFAEIFARLAHALDCLVCMILRDFSVREQILDVGLEGGESFILRLRLRGQCLCAHRAHDQAACNDAHGQERCDDIWLHKVEMILRMSFDLCNMYTNADVFGVHWFKWGIGLE